jgi:hypothetical protein
VEWVNVTELRINKVIQVIENVGGVAYADNVELNAGTSDITLTGAAPLPEPGTITGAVV